MDEPILPIDVPGGLYYGAHFGRRVSEMTPDIDIWRAANLIMKQHGENAEIVAAQRADQMLERGDPERRLVWLRIRRAFAELRTAPTGPTH